MQAGVNLEFARTEGVGLEEAFARAAEAGIVGVLGKPFFSVPAAADQRVGAPVAPAGGSNR
jgi:hypothetical protein